MCCSVRVEVGYIMREGDYAHRPSSFNEHVIVFALSETPVSEGTRSLSSPSVRFSTVSRIASTRHLISYTTANVYQLFVPNEYKDNVLGPRMGPRPGTL